MMITLLLTVNRSYRYVINSVIKTNNMHLRMTHIYYDVKYVLILLLLTKMCMIQYTRKIMDIITDNVHINEVTLNQNQFIIGNLSVGLYTQSR